MTIMARLKLVQLLNKLSLKKVLVKVFLFSEGAAAPSTPATVLPLRGAPPRQPDTIG